MDCRKHNHRSDRGVCPSCLREKLSRLTTASYIPYYIKREFPSPSSHSSSSSPAAPAGDAYPTGTRAVVGHHQRVGSMSAAVGKALKDNLDEIGGGLKKSRSMAFVPRDYLVGETRSSGGKSKNKSDKSKSTAVKKIGFWTKLLHLKGKAGGTGEGFVHTRQRLYH